MSNRSTPPLTTFEVGRYLHVDLTTVINWCEQGKLNSYKTPGGHRRVQQESLLQFLNQYRIPVPPDFSERIKGSLKILTVDDELNIRNIITRTLKKKIPDVRLYEAQDGFEAGKMVLDTLPDLVILDLMLPGIDGFKVCKSIKEDERFKETKILAITGQNTQENRKKILEAGADAFLAKPFEAKELVNKIYRVLGIIVKK